MAKTTNLNLYLVEESETSKTFKSYRTEMNGNGSGTSKSNMQLIDEAYGEMDESIDNLDEAKAEADIVADAFSTTSTYAVGDHCIYNGGLYCCTTAITTAGAWDSTKWTAVVVGDELTELNQNLDEKVDIPDEYETDNVPVFTSTGGIEDSGHSLDEYLPYQDSSALRMLLDNATQTDNVLTLGVLLDKATQANNALSLRIVDTVPASALADGYKGDIAFDSNYVYFCVADDSWKKIALSAI